MSTFDSSRGSFEPSETNSEDGVETRPWITETGRGEGCQRCYSQIDLRRIIGSDGRVVTVCDDCRDVYVGRGGSR